MPRSTRNSRDTQVVTASAGPDAPPDEPRRSARSGHARVSLNDKQAGTRAAEAPKKTPKQARRKQPKAKQGDPKIAKQLEAMVKKQQKKLKAIQKNREDLEQLKKQKAEEQAKLNAERITTTE